MAKNRQSIESLEFRLMQVTRPFFASAEIHPCSGPLTEVLPKLQEICHPLETESDSECGDTVVSQRPRPSEMHGAVDLCPPPHNTLTRLCRIATYSTDRVRVGEDASLRD